MKFFGFVITTCCITAFTTISNAQLFQHTKQYTEADSLRGTLSILRSCYDVTFYHLDIKIDTLAHSISGSNQIYFTILESTKRLQVDLFENMHIQKILLDDKVKLDFTRRFNAVFVDFKNALNVGTRHHLTVFYDGTPIVGKMLPWDGGFKWTTDKMNNQWIAVACQGTGASLWWPNKDHQSDEPDSMLISLSVPENLMAISNGRLKDIKEMTDGYHRFDWFVSYPINNYDVTLNIGIYAHLSDFHLNQSDTLTLDYYVLSNHVDQANKQFKQVKPMLDCYEKYFGKYPFYRDGYKLVETPYLGMEHQSAIAYGNKFLTGYNGTDYSGIGLDFDYIIIHESAHEWWGNSITSNDIADMWIHEGFASYAEVLYTECMYDSSTASNFVNKLKTKIDNDKPIIGPYGVNKEGSSDMYAKGAVMLNTLRHVLHNDSLWFSIILGIQEKYQYSTVNSIDIENFISEKSQLNLGPIFDQYLRHTSVPVLEVKSTNKQPPFIFEYRWDKVVSGFNMPLVISTENGTSMFIYPTENWQSMPIQSSVENITRNLENLYYLKIRIE